MAARTEKHHTNHTQTARCIIRMVIIVMITGPDS